MPGLAGHHLLPRLLGLFLLLLAVLRGSDAGMLVLKLSQSSCKTVEAAALWLGTAKPAGEPLSPRAFGRTPPCCRAICIHSSPSTDAPLPSLQA